MNFVSEKWKEKLKISGYESGDLKRGDCRKIRDFSRIWNRIIKEIGLNKKLPDGFKVLEVGCGGGKHLAGFSLNGAECVGIDISADVIGRAKDYFKKIEIVCGVIPKAKFLEGDFFEMNLKNDFDLVFSVGVIEHFLDKKERCDFIKRMFELTKKGGYVVNIVPNGAHPLRYLVKKEKLGGYDIPEIDYNSEILSRESEECGALSVKILGHNLFNYLRFKPGNFLFLRKIFYIIWQIVPLFILPDKFILRNADVLISVSKK